MTDAPKPKLRERSFRQVVVPRPISFVGDSVQDALVVIGMPCTIDSVDAQLFAPANLLNSASGRFWNQASTWALVHVALYQPRRENVLVFGFDIKLSFRERKRYFPPLAAVGALDPELPLLASAHQVFMDDPEIALPDPARIDITVNLIPDFYDGEGDGVVRKSPLTSEQEALIGGSQGG